MTDPTIPFDQDGPRCVPDRPGGLNRFDVVFAAGWLIIGALTAGFWVAAITIARRFLP